MGATNIVLRSDGDAAVIYGSNKIKKMEYPSPYSIYGKEADYGETDIAGYLRTTPIELTLWTTFRLVLCW